MPDEAIDIPNVLGSGPKTAQGGHSPALALQAKRGRGKPAIAPRKPSGKRAEMLASAQPGALPAPPDFTAETHKRFRPKLAALVALAEGGDVQGLAAYRHDGFMGSSIKAVMRYRDLALTALEARAA